MSDELKLLCSILGLSGRKNEDSSEKAELIPISGKHYSEINVFGYGIETTGIVGLNFRKNGFIQDDDQYFLRLEDAKKLSDEILSAINEVEVRGKARMIQILEGKK